LFVFNFLIKRAFYELFPTINDLMIITESTLSEIRRLSNEVMTNLIIFESSNIWIEYKPSILPSFHDIGVFIQLTFKWLPVTMKSK